MTAAFAPLDTRHTGPIPRRSLCLTGAGQVVTGAQRDRGPLHDWSQLGVVTGVDVIIKHGLGGGWQVAWIGPRDARDKPDTDATVDLDGRLLLPGLIDCHTHAVYAGDRAGEFSERLAGRSYQDIAAAGGGILHTVRATRAASVPELVDAATPRLREMVDQGVRLVEIKSGYGLDLASETHIVDAIALLRARFAGRLRMVTTAMPAHAIPPEFKSNPDAYVDVVCRDILPALAARDAGVRFADVFVERGYFDVAQADRIAKKAKELGLSLKAHVDEFADVGGLDWALAARATSVEHLLVTDPEHVQRLAVSDTVAVGLPLTSVFLREPFAPLRQLVDAGALVALATDCNPGSAMTTNLPLAMQMAVLGAQLTPQEALRATTRTAALALGEPEGMRGLLQPGAPFVATLLDLPTVDHLFYQLGQPPRASQLLFDHGIV